MPSLLDTTVATNYGRMVSTENYTESAGVRTYTGPYTQFGTRQLKFLKVEAVHSEGAVNFANETLAAAGAGYTAKNSLFSKAVRAIQTTAEIYLVGTPGSAGFIVAVATDTENTAGAVNNVADGTYSVLEAAIKSSIGADESVTVTALTVGAGNGVTIA
jgi:hypothetical protein